MRRSDRDVIDIKEIESVIEKVDVCRIAISNDNIPYIVTMNFGYIHGDTSKIYFHCASEGRKLEMLKKNNYVCFQMDGDHKLKTGESACDFGMGYCSIIGYGSVFVVADEHERNVGMDLIMKRYTQKTEFIYNKEVFKRTTILRLDISEMSCKKR